MVYSLLIVYLCVTAILIVINPMVGYGFGVIGGIIYYAMFIYYFRSK